MRREAKQIYVVVLCVRWYESKWWRGWRDVGKTHPRLDFPFLCRLLFLLFPPLPPIYPCKHMCEVCETYKLPSGEINAFCEQNTVNLFYIFFYPLCSFFSSPSHLEIRCNWNNGEIRFFLRVFCTPTRRRRKAGDIKPQLNLYIRRV